MNASQLDLDVPIGQLLQQSLHVKYHGSQSETLLTGDYGNPTTCCAAVAETLANWSIFAPMSSIDAGDTYSEGLCVLRTIMQDTLTYFPRVPGAANKFPVVHRN